MICFDLFCFTPSVLCKYMHVRRPPAVPVPSRADAAPTVDRAQPLAASTGAACQGARQGGGGRGRATSHDPTDTTCTLRHIHGKPCAGTTVWRNKPRQSTLVQAASQVPHQQNKQCTRPKPVWQTDYTPLAQQGVRMCASWISTLLLLYLPPG